MKHYPGLADHRRDKGVRRKPPRPRPAPAYRYLGRHGSRYIITMRGVKGKPALRYLTAEQLATLGISF